MSDKLLDCSASSVQVVSDPLTVLTDPGEDGRRPDAAPGGPPRHDPDLLPGRELVPPGHQRAATVSVAAVLAKLATSTEVQRGTGGEYL